MPSHRRPILAAAALASGLVVSLGFAGTAVAHITPDPPEAPAGSTLPVGFTVEHGCGDSPTVQLDMRLPDGTIDPTPVPPDGWTGDVAETDDGSTVVTFVGGPLAPDVAETFVVEMTLPTTPDITIYFPFVQRCELGEIRWIDIPDDGSGDELDEPAPALILTAAVATTTTAPPETSTTVAPTTTAAPATTQAPATTAPETTTTAAPDTTQPETTTPPPETTTTVADADADDEDGGGATGWIVGGVLAAVVIGGGATWLVRRNGS